MNWNLNPFATDGFQRFYFDKHNAVFNYDVIVICET